MLKNLGHISYHIIIIILSAALALFFPYFLSAAAKFVLRFWTIIENEKIFKLASEIATAVILVLFFNMKTRGWEYRRLARMAKTAGLVQAIPSKGIFRKRRIKKMKRELGFSRELMIIGSTGYRSVLDPKGDLHEAVQHCREAKIMLLNPCKEGAIMRAQSIPAPEITSELIQKQIMISINFLKKLQAGKKNIQLKLYPEQPLLKLVIIGDFVFLQDYATGPNICHLPEYAFKNQPKHSGLYILLYRYFLSRWQDANIPEFDLETDELIYRDQAGNELSRERFDISQWPELPDGKEVRQQTYIQRLVASSRRLLSSSRLSINQ